MSNELISLLQCGTWDLVLPSPSQNMVGCKWIFRIKRNPNSSIFRYKAGVTPRLDRVYDTYNRRVAYVHQGLP